MPMTGASIFWLDALHDCNLDQSLPLPYDRYRLSDEHRTGRGTSISFDFGQDLSHHFLTYVSSNNIQPQHLALAIYYAFLFKLTNGTTDLCVGMNIEDRYNEEFMPIIGMFVNAIPLRCQLDAHWSFHQLLEYIRETITSSMKYSYFPLQRILNQHPNVSKPAFLDTSFAFHSIEQTNTSNAIVIGDSRLYAKPVSVKFGEDEIINKFDFALIIQYDPNSNQLSYMIEASLDLFNTSTTVEIAQRFHSMLTQLFNIVDIQMKNPVYQLSIILPDERTLMESMNNTQVLFPSVTYIHHEFIYQAMKHPQKLAVELDEQSLTYAELLHYAQILSLNLLNTHHILPSEIICQCVERSLSMVSIDSDNCGSFQLISLLISLRLLV
jgi:non-ribosomal peptide synthetase component F